MTPNEAEVSRRDQVVQALHDHIRSERRIFLPPFDPRSSRPSDQVALQSVGIEPYEFGGTVAEFRYQLEGEEDLLHLVVTRSDGGALTPEEGQQVARFLLPELPSALMWLKPGEFTQHFYCGHDELLRTPSD